MTFYKEFTAHNIHIKLLDILKFWRCITLKLSFYILFTSKMYLVYLLSLTSNHRHRCDNLHVYLIILEIIFHGVGQSVKFRKSLVSCKKRRFQYRMFLTKIMKLCFPNITNIFNQNQITPFPIHKLSEQIIPSLCVFKPFKLFEKTLILDMIGFTDRFTT